MAARRMLRRRRNALRRYKTPTTTTKYFRCKVDLLVGLLKVANSTNYDWAGSGSPVYNVSTQIQNNSNFVNFTRQFSYVKIKALSYLANPDIRNQTLSTTGYVGIACWPRGYVDAYGAWERCVDNPYFKFLSPTAKTYQYCNLLGGDNDWKSTGDNLFSDVDMYVLSTFGQGVAVADAPQWIIKICVYCVFKNPVQ